MTGLAFFLVFVFGCLVGASELMSRHSDHRLRAVGTPAGLGYLFLNGFLSDLALVAIDYIRPEWLGYRPQADGTIAQPALIWLVLTAGFGAAAFFRSSIFKLKTQEGEIAIGPALVIDVFLTVIDESVDRELGKQRLVEVAGLVANVDFNKAAKSLPTYCFASLKRLPPDTQRQFAIQLKQLSDTPDMNNGVKVVSLALSVMALVGKPILTEAIRQLGATIQLDPPSPH